MINVIDARRTPGVVSKDVSAVRGLILRWGSSLQAKTLSCLALWESGSLLLS